MHSSRIWRQLSTRAVAAKPFLAVNVLFAVLVYSSSARAEDTEVAFDLVTGRFSSPLPFMKPIKVVVHAPERTQLKVQYWRTNNGDDCASDRSSSSKLVELTAVPNGDVANGEQKFAFGLAPLSVGFAYCFHFDAKRRAPLSPDQIKVMEQAVFDSLEAQALSLARTTAPGASPGPFSNYVNQVVGSIGANLSGTFGTAALYDGPGTSAQSLAALVTSTYLTDKPLRNELSNGMQALYNSYRPLLLLAERGPVNALPAGPLIYDPIRHLDALRARLRTPALQKVAKVDVDVDDNTLLATLYQKPTLLNAAISLLASLRAATTADTEQLADLRSFSLAASPPRKVTISQYSIALLKNEVGQVLNKALVGGRVSDETTNALTAFTGQSPVSFDDAAVAGWPRVGPAGDMTFQALRLAGLVKKTLASNATLGSADTLLAPGPGWKLFVARLELETSLNIGALQIPEVPPTTSEAFPAYIGIDIGLALAGLPNRSSRLGSVAPIQYFGVSLLPSAIDKNDVIVLGKTPWKQLVSLNLGVELLRPSYVGDYGVKGTLADRLLLIGMGLRLTSYLRASAGTVIYSYNNPAPLSDEDPVTRFAPYLSLSLDFDAFGVISGKYKEL